VTSKINIPTSIDYSGYLTSFQQAASKAYSTYQNPSASSSPSKSEMLFEAAPQSPTKMEPSLHDLNSPPKANLTESPSISIQTPQTSNQSASGSHDFFSSIPENDVQTPTLVPMTPVAGPQVESELERLKKFEARFIGKSISILSVF
jgi:hypothetical protein